MKAKVGIFTRPVDQGTSGSGHHLKEMILHFMAINDKFDVRFIHYMPGTDEIYDLAPEIIIPRNPLKAVGILNKEKFDLLHFAPVTIFNPINGLRRETKKVATMHGIEPLLLPDYYSKATVLHEKTIVPSYCRRMDHILTVSKTSRDYYADHWRVKREDMTITYNGLASSYQVKDKNDCQETLTSYVIKSPYLFHVSKYSERKNPWTMLSAMNQLKDKTDLTLVIAGSGWENDKTTNYIKALGLEKRVIFTGFTPENEVVDLLNGASLFLFPSLAEGFGMPNVEAMACGCPVITSRVFAVPEIVGDAAVLMERADDADELTRLILELMDDDRKRGELREAGFRQIKPYNWDESARKMYGVYEKVLNSKF